MMRNMMVYKIFLRETHIGIGIGILKDKIYGWKYITDYGDLHHQV